MFRRHASFFALFLLMIAGILIGSSSAIAQGYRYGIESNGYYGGLSNLQLAPNHPLPSTSSVPLQGAPNVTNYYYGGYPYYTYPGRYGAYRPGYYGYGYGYNVPAYGYGVQVYPGGVIQGVITPLR